MRRSADDLPEGRDQTEIERTVTVLPQALSPTIPASLLLQFKRDAVDSVNGPIPSLELRGRVLDFEYFGRQCSLSDLWIAAMGSPGKSWRNSQR
jgi:hypothetical protein